MTKVPSQCVCIAYNTIQYKHNAPCRKCKSLGDHATILNWLRTILTGLFRETFVLMEYGAVSLGD